MALMFEYMNMLVRYNPDNDTYLCMDNLVGQTLGYFTCDTGPGWVFIANGGLIMDELRALADFHDDLQSTVDETHGTLGEGGDF